MIYSATPLNKAVNPVSPYMYSPFHHAGYRQPSGMWTRSYPSPYEEFVKKAATGIADFLESARKLQYSAQELGRRTDSPFQAREARISDPSAIAAQAGNGASVRTYRVEVHSLASAQKNAGTEMERGAQTGLESGVHRLKLSIGGREATVTSEILSSDTNEQALNKIRDAINGARAGVTAKLVTDGPGGTARLELSGDRTGTDNAFAVTDESGHAAAWSGIAEATSAATNASYSLNGGGAQTSQSNVVELEKGKATATLLRTTNEAVAVDVRADGKKALEQANKLVDTYNETIGRLKDAAGYLNPLIRKSFEETASETAYGTVGIRRNGDGTLRVDEKAFQASLSADPERSARTVGGIARALEKEASRFRDVPASALLNKPMMALQQFAAYQATMESYLQIPTTGLLVNSFF
ncbi:flagellar filament capping protein FliD [Cohnella sp.]|uniref:flagellar filament capping protein FliD n=1 Tax=Cohnella sp. TaxID=1883426 RepID=UPI003564F61C